LANKKIQAEKEIIMKKTKRILSTLLALVLSFALAFSFALPAAAAVNWDDFRITKQPQNLTIKHGDSFTLSVEVAMPVGADIKYQWYGGSNRIANATASELHLGADDRYYPDDDRLGGASSSFFCEITAYDEDNGGDKRTIWSDTVHVTTERTLLGKLLDVTIAPFGYAFSAVIVAPVFIPIFPLAYLGFLIYFYVQGFMGLF
jgi:hypothetical protein